MYELLELFRAPDAILLAGDVIIVIEVDISANLYVLILRDFTI